MITCIICIWLCTRLQAIYDPVPNSDSPPRPPRNMAASTFLAILPDEVKVTRRATDLFDLPDKTPVLAHRHGERRTGGFAMTVGELKAKAAAYSS